jgi:hypothetical protein
MVEPSSLVDTGMGTRPIDGGTIAKKNVIVKDSQENKEVIFSYRKVRQGTFRSLGRKFD